MTILADPPVFVHNSDIELGYPYTSPTFTLLLPTPEFNNVERLGRTRIQTETRGGDLLLYSDPVWPKDDELAYTITNLPHAKRLLLEAFIQESLGKFIRLRDYEDLVWKAIITTPEAEFVEDGKNACGPVYTVSLNFSAELVSWV